MHGRLTILAVAFATWWSTSPGAAAAQAPPRRDFGLGLIIGAPTGLSAKGFVSQDNAIDGALGFGLFGHDDLHLHADFLWHFPIEQWSSAALDLYLGVGPMLGIHGGWRDHGPRDDHGHLHIGARAPFGLAVTFQPARFDVFLEVAAGLWLVEKVGFHLDAAIGGRYWF